MPDTIITLTHMLRRVLTLHEIHEEGSHTHTLRSAALVDFQGLQTSGSCTTGWHC